MFTRWQLIFKNDSFLHADPTVPREQSSAIREIQWCPSLSLLCFKYQTENPAQWVFRSFSALFFLLCFFFFSPMFSFLLLIYGEECSLIVCLHISWASYTSFKECLQYCSNILKRRNACFTFGYTFYFGKIKHCL